MEDAQDAKQIAQEAAEHPALEALARVGVAAGGLLHLLIAWITARIALGGGGDADQTGALSKLREAPGGTVVLWIVVVGCAALALWHLTDAIVGRHGSDERERLVARLQGAGLTVVYGALALTAARFARGSSSDSGESTADFTATLMEAPAGRFLVGAVGLAVVAGGIYLIVKGVGKRFLDELERYAGDGLSRGIVAAGVVGYVAKGVGLAVIGGLFITAAWRAKPDESTGLDGAIETMAAQPFGSILLLFVALGLAAYGLYSFALVRYGRM